MLVRDRMTHPVVTVESTATLADAAAAMRRHGIRRLPVMRRKRLAGIVTWTDLMRAHPPGASDTVEFEIPEALMEATAGDLMTPDPVTIGPDAPIEAAAVIMRRDKIGALPVIEGRSLVGIITESDLFEAFIELTGLRQGGTRLVVDLSGQASPIAAMASVVDSAGIALTSLATYRRDGRVLAVVRVDAPYPLHLVEVLMERGFPVLHLAGAPEQQRGVRRSRRPYATYSRAWSRMVPGRIG